MTHLFHTFNRMAESRNDLESLLALLVPRFYTKSEDLKRLNRLNQDSFVWHRMNNEITRREKLIEDLLIGFHELELNRTDL